MLLEPSIKGSDDRVETKGWTGRSRANKSWPTGHGILPGRKRVGKGVTLTSLQGAARRPATQLHSLRRM